MTDKSSNFSTLFAPEQILCCQSDSRLEQAIQQLIARIANIDPLVDIVGTRQLILGREGCGFMLIQPDVAVIHVRIKDLKQLRIAVATRKEGLLCSPEQHGFDCMSEGFGPVRIAVLMMAPADDPTSYLRAIAALTKICKREAFVEHLLTLDSPGDVWDAFEKTGEQLPDYLEAHHIMRTDFSMLHVFDKLCMAIDLFCREGIGEYPVVDVDGDLVGVVSEDELISLCLPEYITWMEDLSPILNFEPFAEILRLEKDMPVMEIMAFSERYATVDESTPAIQVAKVMMRREVRQVFVVRVNKLVGVISIQDLIQKVLRA